MFKKIFEKLFGSSHENRKDVKIVIIDDLGTNRMFFQRVLEKRGYTVFSAVSGEDGLPIVKKEKPDLVLLDFVMPGMKGPDVCKAIKTDQETKNVPVLFLTSVDAPTDIIACYEQGAENFLTKPIQAGELVKHVEMILEDYRDDNKGR